MQAALHRKAGSGPQARALSPCMGSQMEVCQGGLDSPHGGGKPGNRAGANFACTCYACTCYACTRYACTSIAVFID
jgi:hypothetical protein